MKTHIFKPILYVTLAAIMLTMSSISAIAATTGSEALEAVAGLWYTQDKDGGIELYRCGTQICGRFYWLKGDTKDDISRDVHNPNPDLRDRPLCKTQFMGGFTPDGKGHYTDGWIYSPRHGATFSAEMTLVDHNTLDLHGYVFLPLFGESQIWTRVKSLPPCSSE